MKVKCIAIGNRIMGDDGIGIRVAEKIMPKFSNKNIDFIFADTDIDYTISEIEDGDFLFIFDSTCFGIQPGEVTIIPVEKYNSKQHKSYSQHQINLIDLLKLYKKSVSGYIIGIEIEQICFDINISNTLKEKLTVICEEVYKFMNDILRGKNYA